MRSCLFVLALVLLAAGPVVAQLEPSPEQLARWLKRFPDADTNQDGKLTVEEALAYRDKMMRTSGGGGGGAPRNFKIDPGWEAERFPEHAVSYKTPEEIAAIYAEAAGGRVKPVTAFPKPQDGALRIVGTGHSFMGPGYKTFPVICRAAGFEQPLFTHTGGGITGSTRYKWEQENGIFQFDGQPMPKLLASIANAEWEAMMWGPYFQDRPEFYTCWIEFCEQYNPGMKYFLSDAWIQLYQLGDELPDNEEYFTEEVLEELGTEKREGYMELVGVLREAYPDQVFIMPTSDAMTLAAKHFVREGLPGVEGLHKAIGKQERSLWRDPLGHLGPGFDRLEGYVFYATIYGRSPEAIEGDIPFPVSRGTDESFPGPELDRLFRKFAWQAVIGHPYSGVTDADGDGVADERADPAALAE